MAGSRSDTELYRSLVEGIEAYALFRTDVEGTILTWNRGGEQLFGWRAEEIIGLSLSVLFASEDNALGVPKAERAKALQDGSVTDNRWLVRKDGSRVWVNGVLTALYDEAGELTGFAKAIRDNSRVTPAQEALLASERKYRTLIHNIDEGFCVLEMIFDENGTPVDYCFLEASPTLEGQSGLKDAVGKTARELVPDLDNSWFEIYGQVALTGESIRFENYAPAMGRWFDVFAFRFGTLEERQVAVLFKDTTRNREADAALRESERHFRTMADTAPAMLWITDSDNATTFLSRGWYSYTGQNESEALGMGWTDAVHPDDREASARAFLEAAAKREPFTCDYRLRHHDGSYHWAIDEGRPRFGETGEWLGYIGSVIDIHERRLATDALRKLELERLLQDGLEEERRRIGRELHDTVRQELTGMRMLAGSLQKQLAERAPAEAGMLEEFVDILSQANLQLRELIAGLMPVQINAIYLSGALEREARTIERWYGILCDVQAPEAIPLYDDEVADHLFYIAREALTNAARHSRGSRIVLTLRVTGETLVLEVQDDGSGLPKGYEGMGGWGISSMRHRAELICAEFSLVSNAPQGTTITCVLPLREA